MKKIFSLFLLGACLQVGAQQLGSYVNPMIGTGDHGHVFLGANVPFGMVNAGPTQIEQGWDWCSGYHYSGTKIIGFAQMHLSGTGCGDLGDISLMPVYGDVEYSREGLASTYSHDKEFAVPGYYRVMLDRFGIQAEVTATKRAALYRFTYPKGSGEAGVVIDLENTVGDNTRETRAVPIDNFTIVGYRRSNGWAHDQRVYFCIRFSQPFANWESESLDARYGKAVFEVQPGTKLMAKIAISPTSEANAILNLNAEMGYDWDFEKVAEKAANAWNEQLSRIKATFRTERERTIFYTAMYHYMVAPQLWNDVTGDYMGADLKIHRSANFENLTTWSLWDTYRAAHPLATLIMPDRMRDYAHTMMNIYNEHGELPMWHLTSCETWCMVGEPAVPVLSDMILKGETADVDVEKAYEAIRASMLPTEFGKNRRLPTRGKENLATLGYLPYDGSEGETVAKNLEYYLAAWSAAQVAGKLGHKDDSVRFYNLSMNYKKLYDPRVRVMRALHSNGTLRELPSDFKPGHQTRDYTEGNPWQYSFLVPHDVKGLVELMGGAQAFEAHLDSLFTADSDLGDHANPDISGLIGQYAHGNEPSHHILYMYNYINKPRKTQRLVRQVMDELYTDQPAGLCGNEDVGQMSAWYIMSALGLYQVEPCGGVYQLGSPIVEEATIPLPEGKTFTIRTHGGSDKAIYVKKYVLNGKVLKGTSITHDQIMAGGTLDVYMTK
ncbi:MAG: glycoside hydrolase family 92 protein [Bacteroidaceae bacterium]|nr:glycoside hydrolase family 92 protein [Bacteroidaceae bacterium]